MLAKNVYLYIKERILKNEYTSGNAISELEISKELGVSRTPVREAIIMAEKEGLVKRYSKKGTFIRTIDLKIIFEIIELRKIIEPAIISNAINKIPLEEIVNIEIKLNKIKNREILNIEKASKIGREVHALIFKYSENSTLSEIFERLEIQQMLGCLFAHQDTKNALKFLNEHLLILNKLKNRDIDGAKKVMFDHLSSYKKKLVSV